MVRGVRVGFALLRRAVGGAGHVPAAFAFLARRPRLWLAALMPAATAALTMALGLLLAIALGPRVESALAERLGTPPLWTGLVLALGVRPLMLIGGVVAGFGVALLLAAPLLDRLSRLVEAAVEGRADDRSAGLRWEVAQSLRGATYFLLRTPAILAIGLVPLVGPALSALWAAHALSFQNTEPALARQGLGFAERRAWHRTHRPESLGLGFASLLGIVLPCAGFLVAPVLMTAGTRLVLERKA
jgi:uncharacterized protein involved in cysteine biosynthesis